MIIDINTLNFNDYLLFCIVLFIIVISFYLNIVIGLILSIVVVFIYSSIIFYFNLFKGQEVQFKSFVWMFIFPIASYISGRLGMYYKQYIQEIDHLRDKIKKLVTIDDITGFGNAKDYYSQLQVEMARSKRHGNDLSIMLIKIEYYEEILSIHGEEKMGRLINSISNIMEEITRLEDEWFRIAPDMFSIIMVNTDETGAQVVRKRLKESLEYVEVDNKKYRVDIKTAILQYNKEIESSYEFKKIAEGKLEYDV